MGKRTSSHVLTLLRHVTYLGSHPSATDHRKDLTITFFREGVQADPMRGDSLMSLRWDEITSMRAEDRESFESNVTGTRFLLLGVWALALPKKNVVSYLTITGHDGDWMFAVPDLPAMELSSGLRPLRERISGDGFAHELLPQPEVVSPATRLRQLDELRAGGLITETEHATKRAQIINSI